MPTDQLIISSVYITAIGSKGHLTLKSTTPKVRFEWFALGNVDYTRVILLNKDD